LAQHFGRDLVRFLWRLADVNPALESIGKSPLSSPTGVNLRFYHNLGRANLTRDLLGFLRSTGNLSAGCRCAEFFQQFLRLVFVNIHSNLAAPLRGALQTAHTAAVATTASH